MTNITGLRWFRPLTIASLVAAVLVPRLTSLGTVLTIDEPLWVGRAGAFMRGLAEFNLSDTIIAIQPGVTTAWLGALVHRFDSLAASQSAVAITVSLLILLSAYFLIQLLGWNWGIVAGHFVALDPFLIAHSRVIHTDALLTLFILNSLLAILVWNAADHPSPRTSYRYVIFSGVLMGLAVLTKVFAFIVIPMAALLILYKARQQSLSWSVALRAVGVWIISMVGTVFIAWPALWFSSSEVYERLTEIGKYASGRRTGQTSTVWWFYLREAAIRITWLTTILAPIGIATLAYLRKKRAEQGIILLIIIGIIYAVALAIKGEQSDRYILLTLLGFNLAAVIGLRTLVHAWLRGWRQTAVAFLLICAPLFWLAYDAARLHPYYLAHHNRLFPLPDLYKIGWGEGLEQAAFWIAERDPNSSVFTFYPRVFQHFWDQAGGTGHVDSVQHAGESHHHFVLYRSMFERGPYAVETEFVERYLGPDGPEPDHVIFINNLPYVWIYENEDLRDG